MKRIVSGLLTGLFCVALAGCNGKEVQPQQQTIRIGITTYYEYDTFIGEMVGYVTGYAQQLEQEEGVIITIMVETADNSQTVQNSQVESFIEAGCDVLCVNLVDRTDVAMIIEMAEESGVPVIFFNRELVEADLKRGSGLYYVGAHAQESGRMQGEIVATLCDKDFEKMDRNNDGVLQYVMLEGEAGHQDAIMRTEYSVQAVMEAGYQVERLEDDVANWTRSQAETKMAQWLALHGENIEVVFANNDDMALGAIDALKRAGIPSDQWPVIVGIDGTSAGLEAVALGELSGTVYNDARGQARGMVDICYALATGGELPDLQDGKYMRLPYQIVTGENVLHFIMEYR